MLLSLLLFACADKPATEDSDTTAVTDSASATTDDTDDPDNTDTTGVTDSDTTRSDDTSASDDTSPPEPLPPLSFDGPPPQNILVVTWDTTRPDLFGHYTGDSSTPRLDALLADAVVLEDHRSCSNWTYASMICVQTGSRDVEGGFIPSTTSTAQVVPDEVVLVSEVLDGMGFQTVLAGDQPFVSPENGMGSGFQLAAVDRTWGAVDVTDAALSLMARLDPSQPWYAHVHHLEPHTPYDPPDEYLDALDGLPNIPFDLTQTAVYNELQADWDSLDADMQGRVRQHIQARYIGGLSFTDAELDRLLTGLDELGLLEDTLIVFLTDHGEQLFEHGDIGHAYALYEQENRAIAAFHASNLASTDDWTGPTSHSDIWPSIFDAMGLEPPREFSGAVLGQRPDDTARYAMRHQGSRTFQAIERAGVKLVYWWETGEKNLYRLDSDPEELSDVYDPTDPDVIALWELLTPEIERVLAIHPGDTPVDPGP